MRQCPSIKKIELDPSHGLLYDKALFINHKKVPEAQACNFIKKKTLAQGFC